MIRALVNLPYELARLPFVLLDRTLSDKLPETYGPRVALDRAIGSADQVAGAVLRDSGIAQRGAERIEHSDTILAAVRLEGLAETKRTQAREVADAGRREAAAKRRAAQERAAGGLDEADEVETREKQAATQRAAKTAATKKAAAAKRAAKRTASLTEQREVRDAAARATKEAARESATTGLDEAREAKASATEAREEAARLSELTARKKQKRTDG